MYAIFAQTSTGLQWVEGFDSLEQAQQTIDAGDHDRPDIDFTFIVEVRAFRDVSGLRDAQA